ncbi:hypothetical protein KAR91_51110 [Candidatus Pacearchaeota archaeon]|nr:hypothetical protein [Candidatus Pacearchaeota archaeon]
MTYRDQELNLFNNQTGFLRPVIILGAAILIDSIKDKIKAKYIRAGPKDKHLYV